ncbi:hypothetical protein EMCRGX_G017236 [Ephydatia muelleri]
MNSDTDSNDFLVSEYENPGPEPDDLGAHRWGREHYIRYFPSNRLKRKSDSQSPFTRTFIRQMVKKTSH